MAGKPNVFRPYKDKEYMIELYVNNQIKRAAETRKEKIPSGNFNRRTMDENNA